MNKASTMTPFEKAKTIRHFILTRAAESALYGWGDEFAVKNVREGFSKLREQMGTVAVEELSVSEMDELEFGIWQAGDSSRMIPLWLYLFLKNPPRDNDHRFGYLFESVTPKNE